MENFNPQDPFNSQYPAEKQRHGCVTAWLIFAIIANSAVSLIYFFASDMVLRAIPRNPSPLLVIVLGILGLINVACAIALFTWRKIGFYGFVLTSFAGLIINIQIGLPIGQSLFGMLGIGVLYGILQIRKDNRTTWEQLD